MEIRFKFVDDGAEFGRALSIPDSAPVPSVGSVVSFAPTEERRSPVGSYYVVGYAWMIEPCLEFAIVALVVSLSRNPKTPDRLSVRGPRR
jgi:hypothetical protein